MSGLIKGIVYKVVCSKSNDIYIGSTISRLKDRIRTHKRDFANGYCLARYESFQKHGFESLSFIEIQGYDVIDERHLHVFEQLWISQLKSVNRNDAFNPLPFNKRYINICKHCAKKHLKGCCSNYKRRERTMVRSDKVKP